MLCSGSVYMERDYESTSSKHADLGSDKHELSEIVLRKGDDAATYIGRKVMGYENEVDQEFIEQVQYYVDFVRRCANDADFVGYEMRVDLSDLKNLPDEGGTADAVVLKNEYLFVIDAKFGYGRVPAEENFQLLEYAIGVYDEMEKLGLSDAIKKIVLVIVQPQHDLIDDWTTDVEALTAHRVKVAAAVDSACQAFVDHQPVLTPGPKQCRWCKAFADCPAAGNVVFETVMNKQLDAAAFDDLEVEDIKPQVELGTKRVAAYNIDRLAKCFGMLDFVHDWCAAVGTRMHEVIEKDGPQAGYKLVAGRRGNKKFSDEVHAEEIMRAARLRIDDMFNRKMKSPTQLEKQLKGDKPKVWSKLESLVTQSEGKPVVTVDADRRPALPATSSQFDDLEDDLV